MPSQSNILLDTNNYGLVSVTDVVTVTDSMSNNCDVVTDGKTIGNRKVTLKPTPILDCDVVTDKSTILDGATQARNNDNQIVRF